MAHVIHSINITASGLCHHLDSAISDEHHHYATELTLKADALVFGRKTFELFLDFWPGAVDRGDLPESTIALAKALSKTPKFVVTSRPIEFTWNNAQAIQGAELDELNQELEKITGTVVVFGSPSLASSIL